MWKRCAANPAVDSRGAQAADVPGAARAFQTVHHDDFAAATAGAAAASHQHLHAWLGRDEPALDRDAAASGRFQ